MLNKYKKIILLLMSIYLVVLSINNYGIWTDEVYTLNMIKNSYIDILRIGNSFDSTTLYYILLKTFSFGGNNFKWVVNMGRLFSVIPTIILLYFGDKKLSRIFNDKYGLYFIMVIFGCNFAYYSIEIRSYAWTIMFVSLAFIELIDYVKNNKKLLLFSIFSILAFYMHTTSVIPLFILYLYALVLIVYRKDFKNIMYFFLTFFSCIPPLLYVIISNINKPYDLYASGAINPIFSINKFKESVIFPFDTGYLYLSLFSILIYFGLFVTYLKLKKDNRIIFGLIVLPLTCILLMIIAQISNHDYYPKYMIVSLGILHTCFAIMLAEINSKILITIITVINCISCFRIYVNEDKAKAGFAYLESYMNNKFDGQRIMANFDYGKYILEFYEFEKLKDVEITFSDTYLENDGYYFIRKDIIQNYFTDVNYRVIEEFNISNDIFSLCKIED